MWGVEVYWIDGVEEGNPNKFVGKFAGKTVIEDQDRIIIRVKGKPVACLIFRKLK